MPAWEIMPGSAYFGSCFAADCGPYLGPFAHVTAPVWMPADADEIDFYVGIPNPDGITADFADGSYSTAVYDSYRYRSGAIEHMHTDGGADIPGAHLFMIFYPLGFPTVDGSTPLPSRLPLTLVPPGFVAGGTGPHYVGGHWSDWIDNETQDVDPTPATSSVSTGGGVFGTAPDGGVWETFPDTFDGAADRASGFTDARTEVGGHSFGGDRSRCDYDLVKQADSGGPNSSSAIDFFYRNTVELTEEKLSIAATAPGLAFPTSYFADHGLVEGVDYGPNPDTGDEVDWEDDAATFVQWLSLTFALTGRVQISETHQSPAAFTDITDISGLADFDMQYRWVSGLDVATDSGDSVWRLYGDGDLLHEETFAASDLEPTPEPFLSGYAADYTDDGLGARSITLDLSPITDTEITLFTQPQLATDDQPFSGAATINPDDGTEWDFYHAQGYFADFISNWGANVFPAVLPKARFQQPRWRYWVPGTLVGVSPLRTVGGYWASVGGPAINMKQPDGTWVPITDVN